MLQWFVWFPEFTEFTESSVLFRKNSNRSCVCIFISDFGVIQILCNKPFFLFKPSSSLLLHDDRVLTISNSGKSGRSKSELLDLLYRCQLRIFIEGYPPSKSWPPYRTITDKIWLLKIPKNCILYLSDMTDLSEVHIKKSLANFSGIYLAQSYRTVC